MANQVTTRSAVPRMATTVPRSRSKRIEGILGRDWKVALPFVLPLIVLMAGLIFWPFVNAILISFTTRSIARKEVWVGLGNYQRLLSDSSYRDAVANTIKFTVASVG